MNDFFKQNQVDRQNRLYYHGESCYSHNFSHCTKRISLLYNLQRQIHNIHETKWKIQHVHNQRSRYYSNRLQTKVNKNVKQDRSRRCQNIQSIDNFFLIFFYFYFFLRKIIILSTNYCQIRYLRVRISGNRHFTCQIHKKFKNLLFWWPFCHFFVNAVSHNFQSYQPILLILNSKQWVDLY